MSLSVYEALEAAFVELARIHHATIVPLSPDTTVGMRDFPFNDRSGTIRYAQGAICEAHGALWAIGLGIRHCPEDGACILGDIAAVQIVMPDEDFDAACIAPPPREPHRILHEALVTNESLELSLIIACMDGSLIAPLDGVLHGIISRISGINSLESVLAGDPVVYAPDTSELLAMLCNLALAACIARQRVLLDPC